MQEPDGIKELLRLDRWFTKSCAFKMNRVTEQKYPVIVKKILIMRCLTLTNSKFVGAVQRIVPYNPSIRRHENLS
jgi:hypothetical protein